MEDWLLYPAVFAAGIGAGYALDRYLAAYLKKKGVGYRFPLGIAASPFLYLWIFVRAAPKAEGILPCLCVCALLAISVIDEAVCQIPAECNMLIGGLGCIRLLACWPKRQEYLTGFVCVSSLFLVIFLFTGGRAVGGGDLKLMAAAGLFLGRKKIILAFLVGTIAAAAVHPLRMKLGGKGRILAYGPYLSFGIFTAMVYGEMILSRAD